MKSKIVYALTGKDGTIIGSNFFERKKDAKKHYEKTMKKVKRKYKNITKKDLNSLKEIEIRKTTLDFVKNNLLDIGLKKGVKIKCQD